MLKQSRLGSVAAAVVLAALVVGTSLVSMRVWGGKPEAPSRDRTLIFQDGMTVQEFGTANQLSKEALKKIFGLTSKEEFQKPLSDYKIPRAALEEKAAGAMALDSEDASKNWLKIAVKFGLWTAALLLAFILLKKRKIGPRTRKGLLLGAVVAFGVVLGSDPSPMGTVKDALVLFGRSKVVFIPRLLALLAMLIGGTFIANKFLCSWGCQLGTLQDLVFRLGRDAEDKKGVLPQIKIPFLVSNAVRAAFFAALVLAAFVWGLDIIEPYDPFKIFNPAMLGLAGAIFAAALLAASLFVYRPWCHFLCPFGLVGWLVEKISLVKIKVNYDSCIACNACAKACPSTVMSAILKRDRIIPDCFSCGTCIRVCPTKSIDFKFGKRRPPPAGKFKELK